MSAAAFAMPPALSPFDQLSPPAAKLELQTEWLRLIHYHRTFWGAYRSKVSGADFFLSPDGRISPRSELKATFEHFFVGPLDERKKFQCAFLARRDFLISALSLAPDAILPCPEFTDWIARLNPQKISLIFAAGSLHEPASSFGHVFLKIQNPKNSDATDLLNYAINYAARTENTTGALYAWYGLLGYFAGTYAMAPYHHLIKSYTNMEGRDLWEYELNLTPTEITRLMKHLLELERGYFDYYFLDENCALMIAAALDVARPEMSVSNFHRPWTLPLDAVRKIVHENLVIKKTMRPSLQSEFDDSYKKLNLHDKLKLRHFIRAEAAADLPSTRELSSPLLDAAQNYFSLKGAYDFRKYKETNYRLSLERSKRGDDALTANIPNTDRSPDQGSDASLLSIGGQQDSDQTLGLLKLRAIGYDLLGSPIGVAPFSAYELLSLEFQGESLKQTRLSEFQLVHFLSTDPVSWIAAPLSYGFALERQRFWQAPLQLGYSFDIDTLEGARWMFFATGRLQEAVDGQSWFVPGYQSLLAVHMTRHLRALLAYDGYFTGQINDNRLHAGLAWQIERDLEFRLERARESRLELNYYF